MFNSIHQFKNNLTQRTVHVALRGGPDGQTSFAILVNQVEYQNENPNFHRVKAVRVRFGEILGLREERVLIIFNTMH